MSRIRPLTSASLVGLLAACGASHPPADSPMPDQSPPRTEPASTTALPATPFNEDLQFLRQHGDIQLLTASNGALVAVSAQYQGRVMTSAFNTNSPSLGFVHRPFIEEGKTGTQFDNYGGEDRFWLGPEGGQFGLYFPPGKPFTFEHWQTPNAFQQGTWKIVEQSEQSIQFHHAIEVTNYLGTQFNLEIRRTVELIQQEDIEKHLRAPIPPKIRFIAYQTRNEVTNTGKDPWTRQQGLLSIWILSMFSPTPDMIVIAPYRKDGDGPIVNDAYFGKVPTDRLTVDEENGVVLFRCDGQHRSKIGLPLARSMSALGSYSASSNLMTIVQFNGPVPEGAYVNSMWEHQEDPYSGDVVNSYNDGPTEPGKPALGGFYEIETSSPGLELAPGEKYEHVQRTFHLTGEPSALEPIAKENLKISLGAVQMN